MTLKKVLHIIREFVNIYNPNKEVRMRKMTLVLLACFLFFSFSALSWANKEKTGRIEKNTLTDEKFRFQLKVLSNWKIKLEKEPSFLRSTITQKNYQIDRSTTMIEEERLIPTVIICADTTSLSLQDFENSFIKGKGESRGKEEYLKHLETLVSYELIQTKDIILDSISGKIYGFKKNYTRSMIDPFTRYGPDGSTKVTKEDYLLGELVVMKKGNNLYLIQLLGEREHFAISESEFSKMLETWKFLR